MRNASFSLTTQQMRDGTKDVTRRLGWEHLRPGDQLRACVKCMGLKKGEKIKVICIIEVVSTRREPLNRMLEDVVYGFEECRREGFPHFTPQQFVDFFCASHKGCMPETVITRIEFKKVPA